MYKVLTYKARVLLLLLFLACSVSLYGCQMNPVSQVSNEVVFSTPEEAIIAYIDQHASNGMSVQPILTQIHENYALVLYERSRNQISDGYFLHVPHRRDRGWSTNCCEVGEIGNFGYYRGLHGIARLSIGSTPAVHVLVGHIDDVVYSVQVLMTNGQTVTPKIVDGWFMVPITDESATCELRFYDENDQLLKAAAFDTSSNPSSEEQGTVLGCTP